MAKTSLTFAQRAAQNAADEAARERDLYNASAADMKLLRSRGFSVVREGEGVRVDNARCSFTEMKSKAARERRLLEAGRPG
jgi:hypothetical protein